MQDLSCKWSSVFPEQVQRAIVGHLKSTGPLTIGAVRSYVMRQLVIPQECSYEFNIVFVEQWNKSPIKVYDIEVDETGVWEPSFELDWS